MTVTGSHASPKIPKSTLVLDHSITPSLHHSSPSMRKFFTLLSREIRSYFYSPIAYIVLVFFLLVTGVDFYFQVSFMNQRAVAYSVQEAFFNSVFFWFAFVLIFPLITMRLFAEEFKLGTIEPLMTAPVRDWQVVLAKYFGLFFSTSSSGFQRFSISSSFRRSHTSRRDVARRLPRWLSDDLAPRDVLSLYRLLRFRPDEEPDRGGDYLVRHHYPSFFLGLVSFILLDVSSETRQLLGYFSAIEQMGTLSRGEIDTRPMVLYVSMTIVMLTFTHQAFQSRKWKV